MSEEENLPFDKDEGENEEDYHFTEEDFSDFEGDDTSETPAEEEAAATSALTAKESPSSDKQKSKLAAILAKIKSFKQPPWFKKIGRKKLIIASVFIFLFVVGLYRIVSHKKSVDDGFAIQGVQQSSTAQIKSISDQFNQQDTGRAQVHEKPAVSNQQPQSSSATVPVSAAVEATSQAPAAVDRTQDTSLNNAAKEQVSSTHASEPSSDAISKLQSKFRAVKSTQRNDSRRIKQLERKNQAVSDNVESLSRQVTGLQSNLEQISGQLTLLNNKLSQQAKRVVNTSASAKKVSPTSREDILQQHHRAASRLSYFVEAVIPGRAWLQSSTGRTITVTTGDEIYGYGRITAINPYNGEVKTSSGKRFNYGSGAQN